MKEWSLESIDQLLGILKRHGASEFDTPGLHVRLGPPEPRFVLGDASDAELERRRKEQSRGDDGLTKAEAEELYSSSGG